MRQSSITLLALPALIAAELMIYIYAYNKYGILFLLLAGVLSTYYGFRLIRSSWNNIFQSALSGRIRSLSISKALRNPEGLQYAAIFLLIIPGLLTDLIGLCLSFEAVRKLLPGLVKGEPLSSSQPRHEPKAFDLDPGEWNATPPQQ